MTGTEVLTIIGGVAGVLAVCGLGIHLGSTFVQKKHLDESIQRLDDSIGKLRRAMDDRYIVFWNSNVDVLHSVGALTEEQVKELKMERRTK